MAPRDGTVHHQNAEEVAFARNYFVAGAVTGSGFDSTAGFVATAGCVAGGTVLF
jgi:hypothetical protein